MTGEAGFKAAKVLGPKTGKVARVEIAASSAATDMSLDAQLGNDVTGKIVRLYSTVEVHYRWGPVTGAVDEAALTGDNRCSTLAAKTAQHEYATGKFLILKGAGGATGTIVVHIASD